MWRLSRRLAIGSFDLCQRIGLHVVPVHFDDPIPDTSKLPAELWNRRSELPGLELREESQLKLLARVQELFKGEYDAFPRSYAGPGRYFVNNGMFESVDGEMLYCMVRLLRPRRILEVGSGFSTLVAVEAVRRNAAEDPRRPCHLRTVDPHPRDPSPTMVPGVSQTDRRRVQEVPLSEFEELEARDILFIDSSHVVRTGGDVVYLFLEVVPRLAPGVLVHVHDVFLPADYPRAWVLDQHRFYTEQYLLQALLGGNRELEVLWAAHFLHLRHPQRLEAAFTSYDPGTRTPGSFWFRRR